MGRQAGWAVLLLVGCGGAAEERPATPPSVVATSTAVPPGPPQPPAPPPGPTRAAPFDALDGAQVTVLRLQNAPATPDPHKPPHYPLPPTLRALGRQTLEQLEKQGVLPPGLLPPVQPSGTPQGKYRELWDIGDQRPLLDAATQTQLLDLFGSATSFHAEPARCFEPTMVVSFTSPQHPEPQDVVVSLSCSQVLAYGFVWPHAATGLTPASHQTLTRLHQSLWGPAPPAGG